MRIMCAGKEEIRVSERDLTNAAVFGGLEWQIARFAALSDDMSCQV